MGSTTFQAQALWKQQGRSLLLREDPACKASVKVASFDLNDTLVSSRIGAPGYQVTVSDWQFYNASVPEKLRKLHSDGFRLVIFTNQGNIRSALEGKRATAFKGYVDAFAKELGAPILVLAATMKDQLRKPNGGMWEQLEKMNGAIDKDQSFFVGDAAGGVGEHSADDADFAKTVGVKFIHTNEFFGPPGGLEPSIEPPKKAARLEGLAQSVTLGGDEVSGDPLVLVLVGLPGSGKTTFAQKLAPSGGNSVRWQRICQDLLRSKEACLRAASKALEEGFSVIIDRTDINVEQRAPWVQLASEKGVAAHALIFDVPAEECGRRASERRDHEGGLQGAGVRIVISKLQKMQQAVTAEEGFARVRLCRAPELQAELERYGEKAPQAPKETEPGSSGAESDLARKVILLQSLGFPEASCRKALEASKGDPDAAANQLLAERLTDGATCCD